MCCCWSIAYPTLQGSPPLRSTPQNARASAAVMNRKRQRFPSSLLSLTSVPRLARIGLAALVTYCRRVTFMGLPFVAPQVTLIFVGQSAVAVVPLGSLLVGVTLVCLEHRLGVDPFGTLVASKGFHSA